MLISSTRAPALHPSMQQTNKLRRRWSRRACPDTHVEFERQRPGATGEESVENPMKASFVACEESVHTLCMYINVFMMEVGVEPGLTERRWEAAE